MHRHSLRFQAGLALAVGLLLAGVRPAMAQSVSVFGTELPIAGGFSYALFVRYINNVTPSDTLALVTLNVPAQSNAVANLNPPTGFIMNFDPGFGALDFAEDNNPSTLPQFFANSTQGAFRFTSPFNLTGTTFSALDTNNVYSGTVSLTSQTAPEPASVTLLALGVLGGAGLVTARRRSSSDRSERKDS